MKIVAIMSGSLLCACLTANAQNVKIQSNSKSGKTQVKVKEPPAPVTNVQIKNNPGGSQVKIHSNPSGVKMRIKNHPPRGKKK